MLAGVAVSVICVMSGFSDSDHRFLAIPVQRMIGLSQLDGVPLAAPYGAAIAHFDVLDRSPSLRFESTGCVATFPTLGLTLRYWQGDPFVRASPATCVRFAQAVVTAPC